MLLYKIDPSHYVCVKVRTFSKEEKVTERRFGPNCALPVVVWTPF